MMKKIIICLIIILQLQQLHAQSVGIGTTTPNSKAALDISSTTQGVLIPRMTTTERNAILFPPDGLLIFNTTTKMLNQRQDGFWKSLINNYSWEGGGTGQMYNVGDKVGLNIPSPTERLDVDGKIRSNEEIIIDNPSAIFYLKSGGVNKGFMGIYNGGDNIRFGTSVSNPNGETILYMGGHEMINFKKTASNGTFIQMNEGGASTGVLRTTSTGNVSLTAVNNNAQVQLGGEVFINNTANKTGVGTSSPEERLHVNGKLKVSGTEMTIDDGRITGTTTGSSYNLLPVCYGRVTENGTKAGGTQNFTVTRVGTGDYEITCSGINASSVIFINPLSGPGTSAGWMTGRGYYQSGNTMVVLTSEFYNTESKDAAFHFIIYTP